MTQTYDKKNNLQAYIIHTNLNKDKIVSHYIYLYMRNKYKLIILKTTYIGTLLTSLLITFSLFKISCVPIIDGVETDFCKGILGCNKQVSMLISFTARFSIILLKPF